MRQILKYSYYQNYCIDHNHILRSDRDEGVLHVGGPNMPQTNPRWRTAANLKKISISLKWIDQFLQNLAQLCISALWTPSANKILHNFAANILKKKQKKTQYLRNGSTNFYENWHSDATRTYGPSQVIKFHEFKNSKMAVVAILRNRKITISPQCAINCNVTDNKTANINDKNCSLSTVLTVLTSTHQKLQKS